MNKGIFITIEGNEGSGKSTVANSILNFLNQKNISAIKTREPGGGTIAEEIRSIILNHKLDPLTEAYTFAASRRQHLIDIVIPALKENKVVICDRFLDSSIAYQGFGRELGVEKVIDINKYAVENNMPDLTIILKLGPEVGLKRIEAEKTREVNRLDKESIAFHKRCEKGFEELKNIFPKRNIIYIDASQSIEKVKLDALNILKEQFKLW